MVSKVPRRFPDAPAPARPAELRLPARLPGSRPHPRPWQKHLRPPWTESIGQAPAALSHRAPLRSHDRLGISESALSVMLCGFVCALSFLDKEASYCLTECYNTCFDVTLNKRTLSLCSPGCAWRQFFTKGNKDRTLAISTVQSRFRNVTRHVHPCPGKGLLAYPHLTSVSSSR